MRCCAPHVKTHYVATVACSRALLCSHARLMSMKLLWYVVLCCVMLCYVVVRVVWSAKAVVFPSDEFVLVCDGVTWSHRLSFTSSRVVCDAWRPSWCCCCCCGVIVSTTDRSVHITWPGSKFTELMMYCILSFTW